MLINRHNYEEFFILYMDNELDMEGRRRVEDFVALHPDLKEELELLLHFRVEPDTAITFSGKEELMKINGDSPVTITNYEEWFARYIDNELTADQRKAVEHFVEQHPSTTKDLLLFQRTKLQPETVIFADKASLYRTEKERRIIPVRWWRIAAAAVLVIGLGLATFVVLDKKPSATTDGGMAKSTEKQPAVEKQPVKAETTQQVETAVPVITDQNLADAGKGAAPPVNTTATQKVNDQVTPVVIEPGVKEEIVKVQPDNNLPKPSYNPNILTPASSSEILASNIQHPNVPKALTKETVTTQEHEPSDIKYASIRDDDGDERQDGKKNKLRGFFRKVTRTFEKRTNMDVTTDDNKLLVAGLAINLK
jgi:hypothetical protein